VNMPKIVFFGTGETSLEALQSLVDNFIVEAVITKPALMTSSGKARPTEVESFAKSLGIPVYTPSNRQKLDEVIQSHRFASNVGVVLDYGLILSEATINSFSLGILNSHFSLLPNFRGADPIRAAILSGEDVTGVTIIKIVAELDAGPILTWAEFELNDTITEPELRAELSNLNCSLLTETLQLYLNGDIDPVEQDSESASFTNKVAKSDGLLDTYNKDAVTLSREVRAYAGWPKSFIEYNDHTIIIIKAQPTDTKIDISKIKIVEKDIYLGCKEGSLKILELQIPGKKPMGSASFINGYKALLTT